MGGSGSGTISIGSSSSSSGSVSASGSLSDTGSGSGSGSGGGGGGGGVSSLFTCCLEVKNLFGFGITGTATVGCSSCSTRFCGGRFLACIGSEGLIGMTVPSWSSFSSSSSCAWCAGANRDLKNLLVFRGRGHFDAAGEADVDEEPFAPLSEVKEALPHFLTTPAALTAPANVSIQPLKSTCTRTARRNTISIMRFIEKFMHF